MDLKRQEYIMRKAMGHSSGAIGSGRGSQFERGIDNVFFKYNNKEEFMYLTQKRGIRKIDNFKSVDLSSPGVIKIQGGRISIDSNADSDIYLRMNWKGYEVNDDGDIVEIERKINFGDIEEKMSNDGVDDILQGLRSKKNEYIHKLKVIEKKEEEIKQQETELYIERIEINNERESLEEVLLDRFCSLPLLKRIFFKKKYVKE